MGFKVIAYYKKVTKITFENQLYEEIVFCDYDAARSFVNCRKREWVYDRYNFQIVNTEGELIPPNQTPCVPVALTTL